MLEQIRVVLVETSHPANVGSVARAMKTMGLSELVLVKPNDFPSARASWLASGAQDVLEGAQVVESFDQAITDCQLVLGTSARLRRIPWPMLNPRESAEQTINYAANKQRVALVFGRESQGLTNDELNRCHAHVCIPANPDYPVLNLGAAVQVLSYEVRMQYLAQQAGLPEGPKVPFVTSPWDEPLVGAQDMRGFFDHLEDTLIKIDFLDPKNPRQLMQRLRRLFQRTRLDRLEVNMLRGIFSAASKLSAASELDPQAEISKRVDL